MRIKIYKHLILGIVILLSNNLFSQEWVEKMQDPNINFYEVQKSFNKYWENRIIERSKGYKQYKRWEYMVAPRVFPTGNRIPMDAAYKNFMQFKSKYAYKTTSSSNWQSLGPFTKPSNGGDAGRLNCVAFHPTDANIIYVGAPSGGLWKTTNGGNTWAALTDNLAAIGVTDIVIDYSNPNIIYIATSDGDATDTYSIGILKSIDGGLTFNTTGMIHTVQQRKSINKLIINPLRPNTLFAATSNGIYRTYDGGISWKFTTGDYTKDITYKPGDTTIMYAVTKTNFYKSVNSGASFQLKSLSFSATTSRLNIGVSAANPSYVYLLAGKSADQGFNGLYRSTDGGETFSVRSTTPNIFDWSVNGSGTGGQAWYDMAIAVSPSNADEIYVGGVNIWKSSNGGTNWYIVAHWYGANNKPYVHADIHSLRYSPSNVLFSCSDGGLTKTSNGGTSWIDLSNGLSIAQIYKMSVSKTIPSKIITGWQDNGSNLFNNNSWSQIAGGDGMDCLIDYSNSSVIYTSTPNGSFQLSTNGGSTFSDISNTITSQEEGAWVTPIVQHPTNASTIFAGYINIWKSTNRGNSWVKLSNFSSTDQLKTLAISQSNPNYIYTATDNVMYKTIDGGTNWITINSGQLPGNAITHITISTSDPNVLWITCSGYTSGQKVYESRNAGLTWTNISGNLPNLPANCIAYQSQSNEALYVGMDVGIYYKDSTLTEWQLYSNNLPNVIVNELEISPTINKIRAATYGRGVWESPLYTPNSVTENTDNKQEIIAFPSPTKGEINLNVSSLSNSIATIEIYNSEGKLIFETNTLLNSDLYTLNISEKPNGNYFVKIKSNDKTYNARFVKISE